MNQKRSALLGCLLAATVWAAPAGELDTLKESVHGRFLIGAAINGAQIREENPRTTDLIARQFSSISPENALKWENLHPRSDGYDFTLADRYVDFGERHRMFVIGHTLVWHSQTPRWVFEDSPGHPCSRSVLLARMQDHIRTVMGRYRGRVKGWDVVNEALEEDGSLRNSPWKKILGDGFIPEAFRCAHEADPAAELYYNDYSLENPRKLAGAVRLVRRLHQAGVPITAVGIQEHVNLDWPAPGLLDSAIRTLAATGVKVNISELDVDVLPPPGSGHSADVSRHFAGGTGLNPYPTGLPETVQQALARRYADLFGVYCRHAQDIRRVTFWGVADGDSWLNDWPVSGRRSYPLLFDRAGQRKPAFAAVLQVLSRPAPQESASRESHATQDR